MRKLASIQKIWDVLPIEGADKIELVKVEGWQCVANKEQFKKGDLGVYFEIDSFLPIRPEFEFLRTSSYKKTNIMGEGFKLRTMRFRGQISQGLVLPVEMFSEIPSEAKLGDDVTEILGVKKWEIEERATTGGNVVGLLPYDIPHSDETRCFVYNTKIITDKGPMRIGEIVSKKIKCNVLTHNENTNTNEWATISNYFYRKSTEDRYCIVYPFRFNENRTNTLKGSYNHKVLTQNGWTTLKDIQVGDVVFLRTIRYSEDVIPFISGMLLGDAHMSSEKRKHKDGTTYNKRRIQFCQGEKQYEYLKEKLRILGCENKIRKTRSGYADTEVYQTFLNIDDTIENWFVSLFGNDKRKNITKKYAQYITPISLAFWYMDDGSLNKPNKHDAWNSQITISTHAYSEEENKILVNRLFELGIEAKIYNTNKNNKTYYYIHLSVDETQKFQKLIAKYVCPSMRYKLDEKYQNEPYVLETYTIAKEDKLIQTSVLDKRIEHLSNFASRAGLYNIETTPNHNYFANNILVHNCQSEPDLIKAFAGLEYYISTKMDGSSHSLGIDEDGFHVTGHNYEYRDDGSSSFYEFIKQRGYREVMEKYYTNNGLKTLTIQGEFCAPGIQKNPLRLTKPEWYVFTIRVNGKRVGLYEMQSLCETLGMPTVPIEEVDIDLPSKYPTVDALLERADGNYSTGGRKEGIVVRPTEPVYNEIIGGPLSMKVVSNKYLLKQE